MKSNGGRFSSEDHSTLKIFVVIRQLFSYFQTIILILKSVFQIQY